jgi:ubiquinol-cytochrome c reductase cytochrome c1 subunit
MYRNLLCARERARQGVSHIFASANAAASGSVSSVGHGSDQKRTLMMTMMNRSFSNVSASTSANTASASAHAARETVTNAASKSNNYRGFAGAATAAGAVLAFASVAEQDEAEHGLHLPQYEWPHAGLFSSYDHASIRRGHMVYQQVCAACHSLNQICYRNLVDVAYTENEVKLMAEEIEVVDGPDDQGEKFERPGKLSDRLPAPYANEEGARYANNGAYPPDLSLITKARHDGVNYVFALLLGYREPPAGIEIREGLHYNPYFPGGAIAMPKMLVDGGVEYDDGTIATETQMAKDVTTFLAWAAEPEHDDRKLMGAKWMFAMALLTVTAVYQKRYIWSQLKSRRLIVDAVR